VTASENRIILDVASIEKGETLKLVVIPPGLNEFRKRVLELAS
jgi:hypothetical protein